MDDSHSWTQGVEIDFSDTVICPLTNSIVFYRGLF